VARKKALASSPDVDWLERDQSFVEGLDHLGILVVSTNIYARLLPGVSNLTERARYFSFYSWVFDSFAARAADKSQTGWRNWIRRHEFTLSAAGTAAEMDGFDEESSGGLVGAKVAKKMVKKGGEIDIAAATVIPGPEVKGTYFKNKEGGYAQYYKGPMTDLGLLVLDEGKKAPDRRLTEYAGKRLAQAVEARPEFRELRDIAESGAPVSVKVLAELGRTVHPGAIDPEGEEAGNLRALLLGEDLDLCRAQTAEDRLQRRQSLALALDFLAQRDEDGWEKPVWGVRWAVLEGRLGDGRRWAPPWLRDTQIAWAAYSQNELLTFALECLLWSVLALVDAEPRSPSGVARLLASAMARSLGGDEGQFARPSLDGVLGDAVSAHAPPVSEECWESNGTWQLLCDLEESPDALDRAGRAARLLLRVAADRDRYDGRHPFATIPGGLSIARREIHLQAWWDRVDENRATATTAFFERLILDWVIYRHLRVATRKLASQGDYTFRMRPEDGLLVACGDFEPTFTNPRLRQSMRIMADVGLVSSDLTVIGPHGSALLEAGS
jgi:hypothetical protein